MKIQLILLAVSGISPVLGSALAGGYETVMFYTMYRMDQAANSGKGTIANGCKPAPCNFDEFVSYIDKSGNYVGSQGHISDLDNPDIDQAIKIKDWDGTGKPNPELKTNPDAVPKKMGYVYTYKQDALLGSRYNPPMTHGKVVEALTNAVQENRSKAGAAVDTFKDKITTCMQKIHAAREEENAAGLISAVEDLIAPFNNKDLTVETKDVPNTEGGGTHKEWDCEATIEKAKTVLGNDGFKEKFQAKLRGFPKVFNTAVKIGTKPNAGPAHLAALLFYQQSLSRVQSADVNC